MKLDGLHESGKLAAPLGSDKTLYVKVFGR